MSIRGRAIILPNYVPETDAIIIDCKSSVRHKVHKYVDSQIKPPLDLDAHGVEPRSIPMKTDYPKAPRTLWMIRPIPRRTHASC